MYQVVWSWILWFILYSAYNIFFLCDILTFNFDHRPWKTLSFFFSSCWWNVQSCKILELMHSATFSYFLTFDIRPWKSISIFLSSWRSIVLSCMFLELTVHSVSCIRFPTMWQYTLTFDLQPWKTIGIFLLSCWSNVPRCKNLELTVRPNRAQTDRQCYTIICPVKDGHIKSIHAEYFHCTNPWK